MTVLANALSAADTVMNLGSALDVGNFPAPYTIGSEAILVTGGDNTKSPSILRGQNGTAAAAHAAGTSLTSGWGGGSGAIAATDGSTTVNPATTIQFPAGTLADLGGGTAGLGQVLSLLGPFHLAWNTPNLFDRGDNGLQLAALTPGTVVLKAWSVVTAAWDALSELDILVGTADGFATQVDNADERTIIDATDDTLVQSGMGGDPFMGPIVLAVASDVFLSVNGLSSGTLTMGASDVYAIIATPAS